MSEIPKCKLCDNYPVNYHTGAFGVKHHCDDKHCTLHNVLFTEKQWRTLMGEPESADHIPDAGKMVVSAEPVAFMLPFGDGTFIFVKTLPDYVEDIQASDWLPLYAHPPAQEWVSMEDKKPDVIDVRIKLSDGSEINCWTQTDGDFYWKGGGHEIFICADSVTHWKPSPPE